MGATSWACAPCAAIHTTTAAANQPLAKADVDIAALLYTWRPIVPLSGPRPQQYHGSLNPRWLGTSFGPRWGPRKVNLGLSSPRHEFRGSGKRRHQSSERSALRRTARTARTFSACLSRGL